MGGSVYWTDAEKALVRELAVQGLGPREIANRVGTRSMNAIVGYCRAHGIPLNGRSPNARWTEEEIALAESLYRELRRTMRPMQAYRVIGERLGRGMRAVQDRIIGGRNVYSRAERDQSGCIVRRIPGPPEHVLRERDEAIAHIPTTTQALMGDPPPGRSALSRHQPWRPVWRTWLEGFQIRRRDGAQV